MNKGEVFNVRWKDIEKNKYYMFTEVDIDNVFAISKKTLSAKTKESFNKEGETTMASSTSKSGSKSGVLSKVSDSLLHGGKVAVADEAADVVLGMAKSVLGKTASAAFLSTEFGRHVGKAVMATALVYVCENFPSTVPESQNVQKAARLVLEAVGRDFLQPSLKKLAPAMKKLAAVGLSAVTEATTGK